MAMSGILLKGLTLTTPAGDAFRADGRQVAVVGGTSGLGRAIARLLASKGANVLVVGQTFRDAGVPGMTFQQANLSTMAEAARAAAALPAESLDTLIFTTGTMTAPTREETAEGIERDLAISYLSRKVMAEALVDRLGVARANTAHRPRIFVMGFPGTGEAGNPDDFNAEGVYKPFPVHMNTVAGNEALVLDLAKKHPNLGVYGLNPGLVKTDIRANYLGAGSLKFRAAEFLIGLFTPTPDAYAARVVPKLFAPELETVSGIHVNAKGVPIQPSVCMTEPHVARLMAASDAVQARATL